MCTDVNPLRYSALLSPINSYHSLFGACGLWYIILVPLEHVKHQHHVLLTLSSDLALLEFAACALHCFIPS